MRIWNWWNTKRGRKTGLCAIVAIPVSVIVAAQVAQPPAGSVSVAVAERAFDSGSGTVPFPPGCSAFMIVNVRGTSLDGSQSPQDFITNAFTRAFESRVVSYGPYTLSHTYIGYNIPTSLTWLSAVAAIPATLLAVIQRNPFLAVHIDREALSAINDLRSGITNTNSYLLPLLRKCQDSTFILDGYSFGAWIVKDVYNALPNAERQRVVLVNFGDPTFDPYNPWDDAGTYYSWLFGLALPKAFSGPYAAPAGRNNPYPGYTGPQVRDYCLRLDPVCQGVIFMPWVTTHFAYTSKGLVQDAAKWAFGRWQAGIPVGH